MAMMIVMTTPIAFDGPTAADYDDDDHDVDFGRRL